jgi:hypothetical protein
MQYVCRQLGQETRGLELAKGHLHCVHWDFLRLININDKLLDGRLRKVELGGLHGFVKGSVSAPLHPIIDHCLRNAKVEVKIVLDDLTFKHPHNINIFLRTGFSLQIALRGHGRMVDTKENRKVVENWRAGRTVAQVKAPKLRIHPAKNFDMASFRKACHNLAKRGSPDLRLMLEAHGGDLESIFAHVDVWCKKGI